MCIWFCGMNPEIRIYTLEISGDLPSDDNWLPLKSHHCRCRCMVADHQFSIALEFPMQN